MTTTKLLQQFPTEILVKQLYTKLSIDSPITNYKQRIHYMRKIKRDVKQYKCSSMIVLVGLLVLINLFAALVELMFNV